MGKDILNFVLLLKLVRKYDNEGTRYEEKTSKKHMHAVYWYSLNVALAVHGYSIDAYYYTDPCVRSGMVIIQSSNHSRV